MNAGDRSRTGRSDTRGLDPLEAGLRAFAASRLSASSASLSEIEDRVRGAFRASTEVRPPTNGRGGLAGTRRPTRGRKRFLHTPRPRAAIVALAAAVVLASSAAIASAESAAGRPLFGLRLAVEQAFVPEHSTSDAIAAQLTRLDRRLAEAIGAEDDPDAVRDAMRAYRATLSQVATLARVAPAQAVSVRLALLGELREMATLRWHVAASIRPELDAASQDAEVLLVGLRPDRDRESARRDGDGQQRGRAPRPNGAAQTRPGD